MGHHSIFTSTTMATFYTTAVATALLLAVLLTLALKLYTLSFHRRPHPGIPYNPHSSRRFLGDIPSLIADSATIGDPAKVTFHQFAKLSSPIIQLFLVPLTRPWVFISDPREVEDILSNRTKEFDKAPAMAEVFKPLIPGGSICKTDYGQWKAQSRLWTDVISLGFLQDVAAGRMYKSALELVELWRVKARVAEGRAFPCAEDFKLATFDVIWGAMLGSDLRGVEKERKGVIAGVGDIEQPESKEEPAALSTTERSVEYQASVYFLGVVGQTLSSPFPKFHHWILSLAPAYRHHWGVKTRIMNELIESSRKRFADLNDSEASDQIAERRDVCALDRVLRRASRLQQKNVMYKPTTDEIYDELFLLLMSGHETTATTLTWCVKFLTNNPEQQAKLRKALQAALQPNGSGTEPPVQSILSADIPYLDASLEEFVRLANIIPEIIREATVDATILGCRIPRTTWIVCSTFVANKPFEIAESLRSGVKRDGGPGVGTYFDEKTDMEAFHPGRWLADDGKFDCMALPRLAFSAGPRACFGKLI